MRRKAGGRGCWQRLITCWMMNCELCAHEQWQRDTCVVHSVQCIGAYGAYGAWGEGVLSAPQVGDQRSLYR